MANAHLEFEPPTTLHMMCEVAPEFAVTISMKFAWDALQELFIHPGSAPDGAPVYVTVELEALRVTTPERTIDLDPVHLLFGLVEYNDVLQELLVVYEGDRAWLRALIASGGQHFEFDAPLEAVAEPIRRYASIIQRGIVDAQEGDTPQAPA